MVNCPYSSVTTEQRKVFGAMAVTVTTPGMAPLSAALRNIRPRITDLYDPFAGGGLTHHWSSSCRR